jgi:predicted dehydrogenase
MGLMTSYAKPELTPQAGYDQGLPVSPRPIVILGAGGIVRDAHLPAYAKAGFEVASLYTWAPHRARAEELAQAYGIAAVHTDLAEAAAAAPEGAVFDIALMSDQFAAALEAIPDGSGVLIQKPFGQNLAEARELLSICRRKHLVAAVNTQLRFAPYIAAARALIASGAIGELYDLEVHVNVRTPWDLFPQVLTLDRLEINMHSVHYLDLVRSFLGDPDAVSAVTERHPEKSHANSRSVILLRYRDRPLRVVISTNHDHHFGPAYQDSYVKWEGTRGAVRCQMGLNMSYPEGAPDLLEYQLDADAPEADADRVWTPLPFEGSWFPDAFIGSMGVVHRYLEGSIDILPTSVEDVFKTMALVDAAYESAAREGIAPDYQP